MIKLAKPVIPEAVIEEVAQILRSGNLVQGPRVEQYETALRDYLNIKHVVVVSSGTAALHLALMALHINHGDEVIVPAFTFPATANVVENMGARPILVDIALSDCCLDPSRLEEAITAKTRAIMVVHEFGQAADIETIAAIAVKHGMPLIEDAACAIGARYNDQPVGSFGLMGCLSFHPRKIVTTGEGGAVTTHDEALAGKVMALRNHGLSTPGTSDFSAAGLNYRMTDFQAVIGFHQLSSIEVEIETRIRQARRYEKLLAAVDWLKTPAAHEKRRHIYQTYHVLLHDDVDRDRCIQLLREQGVESNLGAQALHVLPYYRNRYGYGPSDFPQALRACRQGLALPIGAHVSEKDIDLICDRLQSIHRQVAH
jgi:dTDP-4-amino-4,6-dideoxygalactose transaminase